MFHSLARLAIPALTPEKTRKARELVTAALNLSPRERESFVLSETQGDQELQQETLVMLDTVGVGTIDDSTMAMTDETVAMPMDGDATVLMTGPRKRGQLFDNATLADKKQIGNYKILRRIGQGGMGVVYAACLVTEDFQKQVALKLVRPALASSEVLRRFRMERQVLASLDHPNVARVLDAGTTEEGAPYLVMEYVEGLPLDRYIESKNISIRERLQIFLTICDAVQYAHQNLIIHRDLKPSNVLVSSDGVPKLLDFGIAKLIRPEDAPPDEEEMKLTATDARPMSPHYASPEQARGDAITTASDIYSLGVMLYELLTGRLPYEFKTRSPAGIEKTICETEPVPPSQVEYKGTLPESEDRIRKRLRGDLDMILLMAMRKEPQRRYSSVAQFATDVRHYLEGLPVVAQKDTVGYRLQKFVSRHKAGVLAAGLAVGALIASTIVSVHFAQVATQEKRIAETRFQDTRQLARFFITDFDSAIRTGQTAARKELVAKGLDYLKKLSGEAAGDMQLRHEVITGYIAMGDVQGNPFGPNLGDIAGARTSYTEALRLAEQYAAQSTDSNALTKDIRAAKAKIADLEAQSGNRREALKRYLEIRDAYEGRELALLLNKIGYVRNNLGDYRAALDDYGKALDLLRAHLEKDPKHTDSKLAMAQALQRVGDILSRIGDTDTGIRNLESALTVYAEVETAEPSNVQIRRGRWGTIMTLGDTLKRANRSSDAVSRYREGVRIAQLLTDMDRENIQYKRDLNTSRGRLAAMLLARPDGRDEARQLTAQTAQTLKSMASSPTADTYEMYSYAWLLLTTPFEEIQDARTALHYAMKISERTGTADPNSLDLLARAYFANKDFDNAVRIERRAVELLPADFKNDAVRKELEDNLKRFEAAQRAKR